MIINWKNINQIKNKFNNIETKTTIKNENINLCKYCNTKTVIHTKENYLCTKCGVIQGLHIDTTQEWTYYGSSDNKKSDPTRCGGSVNLYTPEVSLSLTISGYNSKLKSIHKRYMSTYKERSLLDVFSNTKKNVKNENISDYIVDIAEKYYALLGNETPHRITKNNFMAACLYYTCRDKNNIRTYIEIANMYNIKSKNMTRGCNIFRELIYNNHPDLLCRIKPLNSTDFINRYSIELKLTDDIRLKAIDVSKKAKYLGLTFKNTPISTAIGCIFLIIKKNNIDITKKTLHEKTSISNVTILKTYNKFNTFSKYLL